MPSMVTLESVTAEASQHFRRGRSQPVSSRKTKQTPTTSSSSRSRGIRGTKATRGTRTSLIQPSQKWSIPAHLFNDDICVL